MRLIPLQTSWEVLVPAGWACGALPSLEETRVWADGGFWGKEGTNPHSPALVGDTTSLPLWRKRLSWLQATDPRQLLPADRVLLRCVTTADGYQLLEGARPGPCPFVSLSGTKGKWQLKHHLTRQQKHQQKCKGEVPEFLFFFFFFFYDQLMCAIFWYAIISTRPQLFLGITYLAKSTLCVLEIHLSSCGSLTMWQWSDPAQGYRDLKLWVVVWKHLFAPNLQCQSVLLLFSLVCPSWVGGKADHPPCITGLGTFWNI